MVLLFPGLIDPYWPCLESGRAKRSLLALFKLFQAYLSFFGLVWSLVDTSKPFFGLVQPYSWPSLALLALFKPIPGLVEPYWLCLSLFQA